MVVLRSGPEGVKRVDEKEERVGSVLESEEACEKSTALSVCARTFRRFVFPVVGRNTLNTAPARIASISTSNTDARATAFFCSQKKTPDRS